MWSGLNKIKKQNHTNSQIPSQTCFNHFTGLLNNANVKNRIFEENITEFIDMHDTECVSCIDNEPGLLNKDIELSEIESDKKFCQQQITGG